MTTRLALLCLLAWGLIASAVAAGVFVGSTLAASASRPSQDSPSPSGVLASSPLPARTEAPKSPAVSTTGASPSPAPASPSHSGETGPVGTLVPSGRAPIADAIAYAKARLSDREWGCLDALIRRESNWRVRAENRTSGAFGLFQVWPPERLDAFAQAHGIVPAARDNSLLQMRFGLGYVHGRYGGDGTAGACNAYRTAIERGSY